MAEFVAALVAVHGLPRLQRPDVDGLLYPPTLFVGLSVNDADLIPVHEVVCLSGVF